MAELVGYYMENPAQMPNEYLEIAYREGTKRGVCDYVACMTDAYAVSYTHLDVYKRQDDLRLP